MKITSKGFTLLEIIMVIGIIVILASVLIPKSGLFKKMARDAGVEANLHTVESLVTQVIYDWDSSGGYKYDEDTTGAAHLEQDLQSNINSGGVQTESDLENPITKSKGMALATASGTVNSFPGGAVAYVAGGSVFNEWPTELAALKGAVGVSAFIEGGKLKVKLVAYDSDGVKFNDEITIVRH